MKTELDYYRGFRIYFDTDGEKFGVESDQYDTREDRKSFAACKKWVDEFLKENSAFQAFKAVQVTSGRVSDRVTVIGIRKDGRPATEDANGNKGQISDYRYRGEWYMHNAANEPVFAEITAFDKETERLEAARQNLRNEIAARLDLVPINDHIAKMNL